jgi:uncharacterized membrane protein YphA (DoxX/SURF4 family)
MRYTVLGARFLLGAPFVVFGLNAFLWAVFDRAFMPPPNDMPKAAASFLQALTDAKFMHPLRGGVEFAGGLMVLSGFMAPLGLAILAPVIVHIVLYHHFLDSRGFAIAYLLLALELFLAYAYGPAFRGLLNTFAKTRWDKKDAEAPMQPDQPSAGR